MSWPTSSPLARELDDFWKETQSLVTSWWQQADQDIKMATGQQAFYDNMYGNNSIGRNQQMLIFNKILRILNMVEGYQRDNRLATILQPSDSDPDMGETADQITNVLNWCMRKDRTYERISDCFAGSNMCGLNLLHIYMDHREDPENGNIVTERMPFSAFIMDPYWTKSDLSDCSRIWTRKYITKQQLRDMFPLAETEIPALGGDYAARDGKFQFMPPNWQQYQMPLYALDEYWKQDYRTIRKLLDTRTGEIAEWYGTREQFQMLRRINQNVKLIKARVPTVTLHKLINNQEMYKETSPWGLHRMPFVPSVCYFYSEVQDYSARFQGLVRNIRDSQIYVNRTRNNLFDMMQAQVQSGVMVKEDALVDPEDAFLQGPGRAMYFKNTANLATDVQIIPPPPVASGWMELIQTIEKEIVDIVGPEELFAQNLGSKEMSGVFLKLKMGAGLTGLRNIFDRLNEFQMNVGEIFTDLVLNNFSVGHIQSIIGKEPSKIITEATTPEMQLKAVASQFIKFNCQVEEGELTSTQRQMQFVQAIQLQQATNIQLPPRYLLEKSTLSGKKELIEQIEQQQQAQQAQAQAQAEAELQQSIVLSRSLEAKAQSDFASAREHNTQSMSNLGLDEERRAKAKVDIAAANLNNAKAIKELEEMDENRLMKLAQHIFDIQQMQKMVSQIDTIVKDAKSDDLNEKINETEEKTNPLELQKQQQEQQQMQQKQQMEQQNV